MDAKKRLPEEIIARIQKDRILGIRAGGDGKHRAIGVWAVVVDGRVFVRSYQRKPGGWWHTFCKDPFGEIFVAKRKRGIKVCAVMVKSEKMKEKVSAAYKEKYDTPGSVGYVAEMSRSPSRDATLELTAV